VVIAVEQELETVAEEAADIAVIEVEAAAVAAIVRTAEEEKGEVTVEEEAFVEAEAVEAVEEVELLAAISRSSSTSDASHILETELILVRNPTPGQDPKVAKIEDALHPANKKALDLGSLKLAEGYPCRPGYGTRGVKVVLTANYVEMLPRSDMVLHRYDISDVMPDVVGKKRVRIMQLLLESPELAGYKGDIATDFKSTLVSKTRFKQDKGVIEIQYRSEGEDEPKDGATTYKIRVCYTKTLSMSDLLDWMNSTNLGQTFGDKPELTQGLNIFLNHYAKSANALASVGSSKTFSLAPGAARGDLGGGLEVIRGFFSSVRVATARILVNINVSHGAFYQHGPLPGLMQTYGTDNTVALEKFLKMVRVQTNHLPEKRNKANKVIPRIKTIFGLARKDDGHGSPNPPRVKGHGAGAKDVQFWLESGGSSSGASRADARVETKGKGKGKGKAQPKKAAAAPGRYISVSDFFRTSMPPSSLSFAAILLMKTQHINESCSIHSFQLLTAATARIRCIFRQKSALSYPVSHQRQSLTALRPNR
jgi:eukaryotic translation initiation factor 2C